MATSKTGSFYLTESITLPAGSAPSSRFQNTIDLSAYLNVPMGQALAVEACDWIWQTGLDFGQEVEAMVVSNGTLSGQVTDLNHGTAFVRADNQSLISSAALNIDQPNNICTHFNDVYPDSFGSAALSEAFLVVNPTLYCTAGNDGTTVGAADVSCTVRLKVRVVKLSAKDWTAIALQSTAQQ